MAQPTRSLQFVCRNCRQSISQSPSHIRAFSSSISRLNVIPRFQPTSSPELDALLLDWRQRVFTPAALSPNHQRLVYKKSRQALIDNDPGVTVTMSDGEDVKLEPLNAFDKPNKTKSLVQLIRILSSTKDADVWNQLPAFLEGMHLAQESVPRQYMENITRKANTQGKAGIIKQCAVMVKRTGLSLASGGVTRELFLGSHERFIEAQILGESFEKEHNFVQSLAAMLDSQDHCGGTIPQGKDKKDMRQDLTITGVLLEIAAARAIQEHKGRDIDGSVGKFAQKLIALSQDNILRREEKPRPDVAIQDWIPIANGIRLALKVNGLAIGKGRNAEMELKNSLQNRLSELDAAIESEIVKVKEEAHGKQRRALVMLENVRQTNQ